MTATNSNNQGLLSSWKEIASYLDCDERTCRRYELNFGLPVHRMEGTPKSRVYAYRDELDAWRKERLNGVLNQNEKGLEASKQHRFNALKILLWCLPFLAAIIAAGIFLFRHSPGQPADFRIIGSKLIVLNESGKELWTYNTGLSNLEPEKVYRGRFQTKVWTPSIRRSIPPHLVIKDINQDGKVEVLFSTQAEHDDMTGEGDIYCFNAKGDEIWHYKVGRNVEFGGRIYSSDFRIYGFMPFDIDDDGNSEIILFAHHNPHSPTQLLILDTDGKLIGEFTNWGRMYDFLACDLDGDGKKEILVAGQNDEYGKGCLVVFDPSRISGCSPQISKFPGLGLEPGSEVSYLLFPRTDVDKNLYPLKETMCAIDLLQNNRIQLLAYVSRLYFELGPDLSLQDVKASDFFRDKHREMKAEGKISSVLDDAYYEELKKGVLYWDGTEWTSTPSMNRKWNNPR
jgi:hypothetical protein